MTNRGPKYSKVLDPGRTVSPVDSNANSQLMNRRKAGSSRHTGTKFTVNINKDKSFYMKPRPSKCQYTNVQKRQLIRKVIGAKHKSMSW